MKIAFIYDAVYPWKKGGAQKRIWELARRLADNHDVHIYGMHYWEGPTVIEREGVTLHGVCGPLNLYTDGRRSIPQALYFAAKLIPALLCEEFDVVDCQEFPYFPCFAGKLHSVLCGSTLVVTWYEVWDDYWYEYLGPLGALGKLVERITLRLPGTVVPISDAIASDLTAVDRTDGLTVVENGVDFGRLEAVPKADSDWDIIYVGRLSEHKNVDMLLDTVAAATDRLGRSVSCGIIGDGPEREALEAHAQDREVDNQVQFLGFVEDDEDVFRNMKAASIFVLPSIREGFPNTILEASACGVPSIVVDHEENGATAVVENGVTGYVTDPSAEAITDCVVSLLKNEELLTELSDGACEFGRRHDWDRIVGRLEQVYSSICHPQKESS